MTSSRRTFWLVSALLVADGALGLAVGCSSSSTPGASPTTHDSGTTDTATTTDGGEGSDAPELGDGNKNGSSPAALYGSCWLDGGFGWPCTGTTTGPDPTSRTDPNFPDCFVGGQGSWCTHTCSIDGGAPGCGSLEDAGCQPSDCNMKGYCK
jgi:hypothetical protein